MIAVQVVINQVQPLQGRLLQHGYTARGNPAVTEIFGAGQNRNLGVKSADFRADIGCQAVGISDVNPVPNILRNCSGFFTKVSR